MILNNKNIHILSFLLLLWLAAGGCKISYSTTGASIPVEAKTFSVDYFQNRAPLINPGLSQQLTENLKDYLLGNTRLDIVRSNGHVAFEGEIVDYSTRPVNIQADDRAAQNRLTITVNVRFSSVHQPELDFESRFSRFADYPGEQDLTSVEAQLIEEILPQLIEDIFNKAFANW